MSFASYVETLMHLHRNIFRKMRKTYIECFIINMLFDLNDYIKKPNQTEKNVSLFMYENIVSNIT